MKQVLTLLCIMAFALCSSAQSIITVGAGGTTGSFLPINNYLYNHSYGQMIYTADEFMVAGADVGVINKIKFFYSSGSYTNSTNWDVYIGHTTKAAFANTSDWVAANTMTKVYSGNITMPVAGEWMEITLSTPFVWNGIDNIVVGVDENQAGNSSTTLFWSSTNLSQTRGIYSTSNSNIDPAAPPAANQIVSRLPLLRLEMQFTLCAGKPVINNLIASATSICIGDVVSFRSGATAAGLKYVWQFNDGTGWDSIPYEDRLGVATNKFTQNTTVRLIATCNTGGQSDTTDPVTVIVNQLPDVKVSKLLQAVCPGDSISITASGANTYAWSPATSLNHTNIPTVISKPSAAIVYSVEGTDVNGCKNTTTTTVTMMKDVRPRLSHEPVNICHSKLEMELWINGLPDSISGGGRFEYQYILPDGTIARNWDTSSAYAFTPPADGKYTFYYKVRNTACVNELPDSAKGNIMVGFGADVMAQDSNCVRPGAISLSDIFGQAHKETLFSNTLGSPANTERITLSGNAAIRNGRAEITASATGVSGYMLVETDSTIKPGLNNAMEVSFLLTADMPINVFGTGGADGIAYSFGADALPASQGPPFNGKGSGLRLSFDAAHNGTQNGNASGIYLVYGWNSSISYGPASAGVLAYSPNTSLWKLGTDVPVTLSVNYDGKATVKVNGTIVFDDVQLPDTFMRSDVSKWKHLFSAGTGGDALRHAIKDLKISKPYLVFGTTRGNTNVAPTVWQDEPVFDSLVAGMHAIWIANPNTLTCAKRLGVYEVKNTNPKVYLGRDTLLCSGKQIVLNAGNADMLHVWNNGKDSQMITVVTPGVYSVTVTDTSGCHTTDSISISNVGVPAADSIRATVTFAEGVFVVVAAVNTERYDWDFGDGHLQSNGGSTTDHIYDAVGTYTVKAKLISDLGCDTLVLSKVIEIKMLNSGIEENALTDLSVYPNPAKDKLKISLSDYTAAQVTVHNMYGAEVYKAPLTSTEINTQDWAEGVYFITISRREQAAVVKIIVH